MGNKPEDHRLYQEAEKLIFTEKERIIIEAVKWNLERIEESEAKIKKCHEEIAKLLTT